MDSHEGLTDHMLTGIPALSPEARLVFRTADPSFGVDECASLAHAVRDWARTLAIAEREACTSVLWRALREVDLPLPAAVAEDFRRSAMTRDLRIQRLSQRAQQTARLLADRGIPYLLLKGGALGALVDPSFRSRPMSDLDILVHREDVARTRQAVIDSGWPETTDSALLTLLADAHHLPHFVDPQMPGSRIELHLALMPSDQPFAFDDRDFWRDARPAPAPFTGASIPSAEHLVLHAAMHFAWQHTMAFGAWKTFRLVAEVSRRPEFDWTRFMQAAGSAKAVTSSYWTLRLAERLAGIIMPSAVLEQLAPPTPEWGRRAVERHFIAAIAVGEAPPSPSVRLARWLWLAAIRPRWSGHAAAGRWDPENKWGRAYGTASTESVRQRLARQIGNYKSWWRFVSGTLLR